MMTPEEVEALGLAVGPICTQEHGQKMRPHHHIELPDDDLDQYDRDERDGVVHCDANCRAKVDPETIEELRAALEHWLSHAWLAGCSHGR